MRFSSEFVRTQDGRIRDGAYALVATGLQSGSQTWWSPEHHARIEVEPGKDNEGYRLVALDGDGFLWDSEKENGFFDYRRIAVLQEAGIKRSQDDLLGILKDIWRWDRDIKTSVAGMLQRIVDGESRYGLPLIARDTKDLRAVLEPDNLRRWEQETGRSYIDGDLESAAHVIAGRLNQIGVQLLGEDPRRVLELAPLMPGAGEFLKRLPNDVLRGIVSGSSVPDIIKPILEAHAACGSLIGRFDFIVGEEHVGEQVKPENRFYLSAFGAIGRQLYEAGLIPIGGIEVGDMLFLADKVGDKGPDIARKRRHSVINVGVGNIGSQGPLSAITPDLDTLLREIEQPLESIQSPTLRRLAFTLTK